MQTTTETRRAVADVQPLAEELMAWLAPHCERITVGGSLRRRKEMVKDVEMVVLNPLPTYFTELDTALAQGRIAKAQLGETGATRWGPKYRSVAYGGTTFEFFTCDNDNAGYQLWLRTGPADANKFMVSALKYKCQAFRIDKGYFRAGDDFLHLPTEADLFTLFGMAYLEPWERSEQAYRKALGRGHAWGNPAPYIIREEAAVIAQDSMFDMPEPVGVDKPDVVLARQQAERVYNRQVNARYYAQRAEWAESAGMHEAAAYYRAKAMEAAR